MVNVYVFRDDGTTPSGWTEIAAGYQSRLILCNGTLTTGGATEHSHTGSVSGVGNAEGIVQDRTAASGTKFITTQYHNHSGTGTLSSSGASSNFPAYKTLRLVYRDVSGWDFKVPNGSVMFKETVPTSDYQRIWTGEANFIMISSTAGSTGGGTHAHSASGTVTNAGTGSYLYTYSGSSSAVEGHNHNFSGTISGTFDYYYWGCGLIKATAETYITKDSYLLFDDTPDGSKFEVVTNANNRYLKSTSDYAVATGGSYTSSTHGHTGNVESGGSNNNALHGNSGTVTNPYRHPNTHTHTVTITLNNSSMEPSYTRLILAKVLLNLSVSLRSIYIITC